jgi:TolB-like protein
VRAPAAVVALTLAAVIGAAVPRGLGAALVQCPDGTPPPCRAAPSVARSAAAPSPLSIAVLPFESRSPDTADAYLAEGMTEEIANRLTRVARLQVKARGLVGTQWRRTPEPFAAARSLGVAWFVHGNVRHVGGQLLVNVELVRATTGEEAWAARFPRRDADVFAVQAEIAESVAVVVGGRLTPGEHATIARRPTRDNEAYRLYLYGNALIARRTERDAAQAVAAYERAVALDPSFAAAWARVGIARGIQASWSWEARLGRDSLLGLARAGARRALGLDSTVADAWVALGFAEAGAGNLGAARDGFERAIRLDSLNPEAFHLYAASVYSADCPFMCLDLDRAAIPLLRRALALDPTLRNTWRHLAAVERDAGRLAEAEAHLDTALSFGPWAPASADRAYIRFLRGNSDGALADHEARIGVGQSDSDLPALVRLRAGDSVWVSRRIAALRADTAVSLTTLAARARLAAALGLRGEALDVLERLRVVRDGREPRCTSTAPCSTSISTWRVLHDPIFAPLREEPRFQQLWEETRPRVPWLDLPLP